MHTLLELHVGSPRQQPTGAISAHVMALTHKPSFGRSVSQKGQFRNRGLCCSKFLPSEVNRALDLPQVYFQRAHGGHSTARNLSAGPKRKTWGTISPPLLLSSLRFCWLGFLLNGGCLEIDLWQV